MRLEVLQNQCSKNLNKTMDIDYTDIGFSNRETVAETSK